MNKEEENFEIACRFVIRLGTLAHRYGTQARRLESYLLRVIRTLGYNGIFRSTPTEILFTFIKKDELWHKTHIVYMPGTGIDLAKLAKIGELVTDLESGQLTLLEANESLDKIEKLPAPFGKVIVALGYALSGAGFAGFLLCGVKDIILSAVLSIIVYIIVLWTEKLPERFEHWAPFLCTFTSGILAALISISFPELQVYLITLSSVIYLVPGFTISNGVMELTYKYVLSGVINIVNGVVYLALLFAGAWIGITMVRYFFPVLFIPPDSINPDLKWLSAMIMSAGLCLVFQTPKRDFLWAVAGCAIACGGIILGIAISSVNLGNFLGTVFAVVFANIWSAKTNRSASLVLLPAVVFLVSGSIGFRGFVDLSIGNTVLGQQELIHMFVVALSIAAGLIVGNSIYKSKITL